MTVDGRDVSGNHVIKERHNISISCFFDKGNPPAVFRLLDKKRRVLQAESSEGGLTHSLSAQCERDWPSVMCEGNSSESNASVSFVVICKCKINA